MMHGQVLQPTMIEHISSEIDQKMERSANETTNNSNGNLNNNNAGHSEQPNNPNTCFRSLKTCCKMKTFIGLEDFFWLLSAVDFVAFIIWKHMSRISWSQWIYLLFGSVLLLVLCYILATAATRFVLDEDASPTAHWNAHARFTQAALTQSRLKAEEQAVTTVAPPKMGGAKLNIRYTVGDVPLAQPKVPGAGVTGITSRASSGNLAATGASALSSLVAQKTLSAASSIMNATTITTTGTTSTPASTKTTSVSTISSSTVSPSDDKQAQQQTTPTTTAGGGKKKAVMTSSGHGHHSPSAHSSTSVQRESLVPAIIEEEDRVESPSSAQPDDSEPQ